MDSHMTRCKCAENNNNRTISEQTNINSSSLSCGSCHLSIVKQNCSNNSRTTTTNIMQCKMRIQFFHTNNKLISSVFSLLLFLLCSSVIYSNSTLNVIIEDQVAQVGHFFHYNILSNDSALERKFEIKVSEAGSDKLPHWLLFDNLLATFSGVPSVADEGNIFVTVQLLDNNQVVLDEVFSIEVRPAGSVLLSRKLSKLFLQRMAETSHRSTQSVTMQQSQKSSTILSKQPLYFLPIHCTTKSNMVIGNLLLKLKNPLAPTELVNLFTLLSDSLGVSIDKLYLSDKEYSKFDSKVVLWGHYVGSDSLTSATSNQTFTLISFIIGCSKDVMYSDIYRVIIQRLDELLESVDKLELLQNVLERWFITVEGDDVSEAKRLHERRRRQAAVLLTEIPEPNFDIVFTTAVTDMFTTSIVVPTTLIPSMVTTQPVSSITPSLLTIAMTSDLLTIETILTATPSFVVSSAIMVVDSTSIIPTPSITPIEPSSTIPVLFTTSLFTSAAAVLTTTPSFSVDITSLFPLKSTPVIIVDSTPVITPSTVLTTIGDESSIPSLVVTTPVLSSVVTSDVIFTPSFVVTSFESLTPFISPSETSQPAVITMTTVVLETSLITETLLSFSPFFTTAVIDTSSFPLFTAPSVTETSFSSPVIVFPSSTFLETSIEIQPPTTLIVQGTSLSMQPSPFVTSVPVFTETVLTTAVTSVSTSPVLSTFIFTTPLPDTSLVTTTTLTSITSLLQPSLTLLDISSIPIETTPVLLTTFVVMTDTSILPIVTSIPIDISSSVVVPPSISNIILPTSTMSDTSIMSSFISPSASPNVTIVSDSFTITTTPTPLVTSIEITDFTVVVPSSSVPTLITTVVFTPTPSFIIDTSQPIETSSIPAEVTTAVFTPTTFLSSVIADTSQPIETSSMLAQTTTVILSPTPFVSSAVLDTSQPIETSSMLAQTTTVILSPTPFVSSAVLDTSQPIETSGMLAQTTTLIFSPTPFLSSAIADTSQPIETSSMLAQTTTPIFSPTPFLSSAVIDTSQPIESSSMPVQITTIIFRPTSFVSSAVLVTSQPIELTTTLPAITVPSIITDTFSTTSFVVLVTSPIPVSSIVSPITTSEVVSFVTPTPSMSPVSSVGTTVFVPTTTLPVFTVPSVTTVVPPDTSSFIFVPTSSEVFDVTTMIPSSVLPTTTSVIADTSVSAIPSVVTTMLLDSSEIIVPTTTLPVFSVFTPSLVASEVINTTTVIGDTSVTETISPTPTLFTTVIIPTTSTVNVSSSVMDVPTSTLPVFSDLSMMTSAPVFTITAVSPSVTSMAVFTIPNATTFIAETSQVVPTTTVILPTTTVVPITTMVTTMVPTPTPTRSNQAPQLINPINPLMWSEGQPAMYEIPENTFYDTENGSTSNLVLSLQHSTGQTVANSTWIQLINGVLYGLPLQEQIDNLAVTEHVFILVAQDPQNAIARDFIVISVLPQDPFIANFITFFVDGDFNIFNQQIISKIGLVNRLASFGPSNTTSDVYVQDLFDGSIGLQYGNTTIPNSECETFNKLVGLIYNNVTMMYSNSFATALMPYVVTKVPMIDGPCLQPVGPNVSDVSTIEERSSNKFYYTIIPGVVVAVILLVGAILACVLYRRTYRERKKIYRENLDVTFINRRAIILEAEDRNRPKRSHRPTVMYGELPQYVTRRKRDDEVDGGEPVRPPAHEKEPLIPDFDPPAYQLAPIFDDYAICHEESQD
ncbi:uncharacterized protein [Dysidea avara]|uniref:uncharacterized protein n=1 Tax=Dysidea avara TaxID=196820 RepID=UPI00332BEF09